MFFVVGQQCSIGKIVMRRASSILWEIFVRMQFPPVSRFVGGRDWWQLLSSLSFALGRGMRQLAPRATRRVMLPDFLCVVGGRCRYKLFLLQLRNYSVEQIIKP